MSFAAFATDKQKNVYRIDDQKKFLKKIINSSPEFHVSIMPFVDWPTDRQSCKKI